MLDVVFWFFTGVFLLFSLARLYIAVTNDLTSIVVYLLLSLFVLMGCMMVFIGRWIIHSAGLFLMTMHKLQNYEFRRHRKAVFLLATFTCLTTTVAGISFCLRSYEAAINIINFRFSPDAD
jgi:hypothetical protein